MDENSEVLEAILLYLVEEAHKQPGVPQQGWLSNGLRLDVHIHEQETHFQVSGDGYFPSMAEYYQILDHFPYPIEKRPVPKPTAHSGRYFLTMSWPTPTGEPTYP
jgi:hypothetical protein